LWENVENVGIGKISKIVLKKFILKKRAPTIQFREVHALLLFSYPTGGNKDEIRIIRALLPTPYGYINLVTS
jgi:hypothetical protein